VNSDRGAAGSSSVAAVARSAVSNAYPSAVDADSVTLPRPWNRCSTSTVSPRLGASPFPKVRLLVQSSIGTIECARLSCITWSTKMSSIAVVRSDVSAVVAVAR
jgi:hypothetical protein